MSSERRRKSLPRRDASWQLASASEMEDTGNAEHRVRPDRDSSQGRGALRDSESSQGRSLELTLPNQPQQGMGVREFEAKLSLLEARMGREQLNKEKNESLSAAHRKMDEMEARLRSEKKESSRLRPELEKEKSRSAELARKAGAEAEKQEKEKRRVGDELAWERKQKREAERALEAQRVTMRETERAL